MEKLTYLYYFLLVGLLLWGAKLCKKGEWNDEFLSLSQTKALQGFCAVCIMFHHIAQKTCAFWLNPAYIVPGLDCFVPLGYFFVGFFLFCSGYGLYKSYTTKPNYLKGFFAKRVLPIILAFYITALLFFIVRLLMGEQISPLQAFFYLSGLQLSNSYSWFAIVLPLFYLGFYLSFRFCKKTGTATLLTCFLVLIYTIIGTLTDHNVFWMRGEWWYNSVHLFSIGLLFARYESKIIPKIKKHYGIYLCLTLFSTFLFFFLSEWALNVYSYYGEDWGAPDKVYRRWVCLLTQIAASWSFVNFILFGSMKLKINNKVLQFFGSVTLEFYLIHGLFVELFGYSFMDITPSLYYIRNVSLFVLVVWIPTIPFALLLQKIIRKCTGFITNKK